MATKKTGKRDKVVFPKGIDWGKLRNDEIAKLVGCTAHCVYRHRRANDLPAPPRKPGSGAQPRIQLSKINMKNTPRENAQVHQCSYGYMLQLMHKKRAAQEEKKAAKAQAAEVTPGWD